MQSLCAVRSMGSAHSPRVQAAPAPRGRDAGSGALQAVTLNCAPLSDPELPQALGVTYWFEAAPDGDPYQMKIRFAGRRAAARANREARSV